MASLENLAFFGNLASGFQKGRQQEIQTEDYAQKLAMDQLAAEQAKSEYKVTQDITDFARKLPSDMPEEERLNQVQKYANIVDPLGVGAKITQQITQNKNMRALAENRMANFQQRDADKQATFMVSAASSPENFEAAKQQDPAFNSMFGQMDYDQAKPFLEQFAAKIGDASKISKQFHEKKVEAVAQQNADTRTAQAEQKARHDQFVEQKTAQAGVSPSKTATKATADQANQFSSFTIQYSEGTQQFRNAIEAFKNGANAGIFSTVKSSGGVVSSVSKELTNALTPEQAQQYQTVMKPMIQNIQAIKSTGAKGIRMTQAQLDKLEQSLIVTASTTQGDALAKMAEARQLMTSVAKPLLEEGIGKDEQRQSVIDSTKELFQEIPWTSGDIFAYQREKPKKPFMQWLVDSGRYEENYSHILPKSIRGDSPPPPPKTVNPSLNVGAKISEGQTATSKSGRPIVYKNGAWVYAN